MQDLGFWNLPDNRFVVFWMTKIRVFIDEKVLENRRKYGFLMVRRNSRIIGYGDETKEEKLGFEFI